MRPTGEEPHLQQRKSLVLARKEESFKRARNGVLESVTLGPFWGFVWASLHV